MVMRRGGGDWSLRPERSVRGAKGGECAERRRGVG